MLDRVKKDGRSPPTLARLGWFTIIMKCTPESGHLCVLCDRNLGLTHGESPCGSWIRIWWSRVVEPSPGLVVESPATKLVELYCQDADVQ
jgi:hypothetical protein